jgi:hypothetical protein
MEKKKIDYRVFWQAFLLAVTFMVVGLYLGITLEQGRLTEINDYYIQSEVSLIDILALENLVDSSSLNCEDLKSANIALLDRVYEEALLLDEYETAGRITDGITSLHKKYDVLRAYLWINSINIKRECNDNFDTLVYFYNYEETDLTKKAEQNVWSKLLSEIKAEKGDSVVLIPIAADTGLESINAMLNAYGVESFPSVIVNEDVVIDRIVQKDYIFELID